MMPQRLRFSIGGLLVVGAAGLVLVYYLFLPTVQKDFSKSNPGNTLAQVAATTYPNDNSPLGTNLSPVSYYSPENPFIDIFKMSAKWITSTDSIFDTGESGKLDLDSNGWVKSLTPIGGQTATYTKVITLMLRSFPPPYYAPGQYLVLYDGEGIINYRYDAKKNAALSTPGRDVLDIVPTGTGIQVEITATDPNRTGNYIRNIRIVRADQENLLASGEIFSPDFLERVKKYRLLRFMDWMLTNNSAQSSWSTRSKETDATYTNAPGVPLEVMIKLSNKLHADPWFNMPHLADDNYKQNFAQVVKDQLDPSLKVYVEDSNEVWNPKFQQYHYVKIQAEAMT